jgi:GTP-binding protein HflX
VAVVGQSVQNRDKPHPNTYLGPGKVEEVKAAAKAADANVVACDDELSPRQERNLEGELGLPVIDRTAIILDIFADHANSAEGKLQVELAQLQYNLARMRGLWTHLERLGASASAPGIGTRGPGETQIETDRRLARDRISALKRKLAEVKSSRAVMRAERERAHLPQVALVGYTNAGKSTLFNRITGAGVLAEDMLFATLDPTLRRMKLPHGRTVILSDTVGFISDLPTHLVAAFRATLEEVLEADLVLHVRDMADVDNQAQSADVLRILKDLGIDEAEGEKRIIEVWNKIDRLEPEFHAVLVQKAQGTPNVVAVSAVSGEGIDGLMDEISRRLSGVLTETTVTLPVDRLALLPWLYDHAIIDSRDDNEDGSITLDLRLSETEAVELERRLGNGPKAQREDWE